MGDWENWTRRAKTHMKGRITQETIAERLGVTQGQVGHWLNGRRKINLHEFFALCDAIGADAGEILFGKPSATDIKRLVADEVEAALSAHPELARRPPKKGYRPRANGGPR